VEAARKRWNCKVEEERSEKRQKKTHSGNFDRMTWDKEALKKEVESKKDGKKINWSEVACRYHVTHKRGEIARNGRQIVQEWLVNQGVNIHRFNPQGLPNKLRARQKKKRGQGGEISIPVPETTANCLFIIFYILQYENLVIDKDGNIKKTQFVVEGRKQPLEEIHKKTLKLHENS